MVEKKQFVKRISKKKKFLCHKDTKEQNPPLCFFVSLRLCG